MFLRDEIRKKRKSQARIRLALLAGLLVVSTFAIGGFYKHHVEIFALFQVTEVDRSIIAALPLSGDAVNEPEDLLITDSAMRIQIPSIGVDAAVEHVGLTPDGAMDVPADPMNAAWYSPGVRPGDVGSAVIDGHVDWYDGEEGVFENLKDLKPGDEIVVLDEGEMVVFVVRKIRKYDPEADATDVFISTDGAAHLNLITCDGVWDEEEGQYTERLVVFTDKKME